MIALDLELAALEAMSPAQLRCEWQHLFKSDPPSLSVELLRHAIGYRLQERRLARHADAIHRELRRIAAGRRLAAPRLKTGTRLVRSWNGRNVDVLVTDDGFAFEERRYRSLSAIANEVTGTKWSGPRFFGLTEGGNRG